MLEKGGGVGGRRGVTAAGRVGGEGNGGGRTDYPRLEKRGYS